ncbi:MAG: GTP 3',8-cyclase MoaA [Gammaproteobacteria bacterium]|nr:GTP 3',8-cyclase MoaA [Gammaproteobacteria bacterium]
MKKILHDRFGRKIEYLRLSVTDRCDMKCDYCRIDSFKDYSEKESWLNFDEIERIVRAFVELGVGHVRLTGGEPLLRKNIDHLAQRLSSIDQLTDLSLSTNCSRIESMADRLYRSGVQRLNVSLDTLNPDTFYQITKSDLSSVLTGLQAAKKVGFDPIRINTVVMRGVNDTEIEQILDYCSENSFTLRLIETMPMGQAGQDSTRRYIDLQEIKKSLQKKYNLIPIVLPGGGPARYYHIADSDIKIGFITPLSQHFCDTCNRIRLTVDGILHTCLGQEHEYPLRDIIRHGVSDKELKQHIMQAIALKPEKHEFKENPTISVRSMTRTGG